MHLLQALKRKWLNWITTYRYSQDLPCNSVRGLDRPGFGNSGRHPIGVGVGVVGCGVRQTSFVRTKLQFWGNFVTVVSLHTQLEFWWVWGCPRTCCKDWRESDSIELLISDICRVYHGIQLEVLTGLVSVIPEGRAIGVNVVGCGVPERTFWGQVSSNFVNHAAWFWIECESVHALVASIELASDSIELLLSDILR